MIWTHVSRVAQWPGTFWRTLYQLSYRAKAKNKNVCKLSITYFDSQAECGFQGGFIIKYWSISLRNPQGHNQCQIRLTCFSTDLTMEQKCPCWNWRPWTTYKLTFTSTQQWEFNLDQRWTIHSRQPFGKTWGIHLQSEKKFPAARSCPCILHQQNKTLQLKLI